jgi:hypothetical protein
MVKGMIESRAKETKERPELRNKDAETAGIISDAGVHSVPDRCSASKKARRNVVAEVSLNVLSVLLAVLDVVLVVVVEQVARCWLKIRNNISAKSLVKRCQFWLSFPFLACS